VLLLGTLRNARRPDIDGEAVLALAEALPDDPDQVREHVLTHLIPYAYDWDVYGVPYYFPTLAEALRQCRGDCKSQALVLASLLAAKAIPFRLLVSLDHIWVEYAGKQPAPMEDPAVAVAEFRDGRWHALRPSRLNARSHAEVSAAAYWQAAPRSRKFAVAGALLALLLWSILRGAGSSRAS
jgi:transglutaminase-like putative cysteine protease